jgi:hypothetical protein
MPLQEGTPWGTHIQLFKSVLDIPPAKRSGCRLVTEQKSGRTGLRRHKGQTVDDFVWKEVEKEQMNKMPGLGNNTPFSCSSALKAGRLQGALLAGNDQREKARPVAS